MNNLRLILVVALSLVLLQLWQEWELDYGVPGEAPVETNGDQNEKERRGDATVPVIPTTPEKTATSTRR